MASASSFLCKDTAVNPIKIKRYCENIAVNAVVSYYTVLANSNGIASHISLDIPDQLAMDSLELSMAISNLLENAVNGCEALTKEVDKQICFTCRHVGRLVLEMSSFRVSRCN